MPQGFINSIPPRDFCHGPVVQKLPSDAGSTGSIPGQGTKIPHAAEQLRCHASTTEPASLEPMQGKPWHQEALMWKSSPCSLQLEKALGQQRRPNTAKKK